MSGRVFPWQRRCCWLYFARWRADASATRNGLYKRRISRKQTPKRVLFTASSPALRNFLNVAWLGIRIAKPPLWRLRATTQVDRNRSRNTIELVKPPSEFPLCVLSALRRRCHAREREHPAFPQPFKVCPFCTVFDNVPHRRLELARASRAVVDALKTRELRIDECRIPCRRA